MQKFRCPTCGYEATLEAVQLSGTIVCRGKCKGGTVMKRELTAKELIRHVVEEFGEGENPKDLIYKLQDWIANNG